MSGEELNKIEVLKKAQEGDEKAFEELVNLHYNPLYRVVYQMAPNSADVEEILQETFYRFYLSLKRLKQQDPFPFLRQIAIRRTYTFLAGKKKEMAFEEIPETSKELLVEGAGIDLREIYAFAGGLPAKRRMVFILREILGFEDKEISAELGVSEVTVRRHAQMAKEELKKYLSS